MATSRLAFDLRDGRAWAIQRVRRALEKHGTLVGAASDLGIQYQQLYRWTKRGDRRGIPAVADIVDELGMRHPEKRPGSRKSTP